MTDDKQKQANVRIFGTPNMAVFDIPVGVIQKLGEDGLDILMSWLDHKYRMVHENGRYDAANAIGSYWRDYLRPKLEQEGVADLDEWEKHWLDCSEKIKEGPK